MKFPKTIHLGIPFFIFVVLLLLVLTDVFYVESVTVVNLLDRVFYLTIHTGFWLSAAFLFNSIVNKYFWGGIVKVPVGSIFLKKVKDFFNSLSYLIVFSIIITQYFSYEYNFNLFAFVIVLSLAGMILHPYLTGFARTVFLSNSALFNIADRVKLTSINSNTVISGEVDDVDRRYLKLISDDNNIITVSQSSLQDFVIKNYSGSGKETRFEIKFTLEQSIEQKRIKRIFTSAVIQAFEENKINSSKEPEILIDNVTPAGFTYSVNFWITPWEEISPEYAKDKIYEKLVKYLQSSGINITSADRVLRKEFTSEVSTGIYTGYDTVTILKNIELFSHLNNEEIKKLAAGIIKQEKEKGVEIIKEGESGDSMFIVVEGLLDVFVKSKNNELLNVGRLAPGEFFGEMSLMTGEERSATVKTQTDALLFEINKENISGLINGREEIINEFGEIISRRTQLNVQLKDAHEKSKQNILNELIGKIKKFFKRN